MSSITTSGLIVSLKRSKTAKACKSNDGHHKTRLFFGRSLRCVSEPSRWFAKLGSSLFSLASSSSLSTMSNEFDEAEDSEDRLFRAGASDAHIRSLLKQQSFGSLGGLEPATSVELCNILDQIFGKMRAMGCRVNWDRLEVLTQTLACCQSLWSFPELWTVERKEMTYLCVISLSCKELSQILWHDMSRVISPNAKQETLLFRLMNFQRPHSALQWLDIFKARLQESANYQLALEVYHWSRQSMAEAIRCGRDAKRAPKELATLHFVHQIRTRLPDMSPAEVRLIVGLHVETEAAWDGGMARSSILKMDSEIQYVSVF